MDAAAVGAPATGRAAGLAGLAVAALAACSLFLSDGSAQGPLVALGIAAVAVGTIGLALASARLPLVFLGALAGLVVWSALTILWSTEPSNSWSFSNRVLAYLGFACAGLAFGSIVREAPRALGEVLAVLLAALFGWALLAKIVPSIYPDYERVARLRSPVGYWNELALLADVAVALALWLATSRARSRVVRATAVSFLFLAVVALFLTYSRFGIVIGALVVAAWLALERGRVESVVALVVGGVPAIVVFGVALALPGITSDGVTHGQRAHDGRLFALAVVVGLAVSFAAAFAVSERSVSQALRVRVDRLLRYAAVAVAVLAVILVAVFAHRIWHSFTNASNVELGQGANRLGSASSSNRWGWWQEAWNAFVRHPGGGTGGGTFGLTNELHRTNPFDVAVEPHNVALQFLTETGIVGFLLWIATFVSVGAAVVRRRGDRAAVALGLGLAAWLLHMVVDIDWSYVAVCGPLFLVAGALLARPASRPARARALPALGAVVLALACAYSLAAPWLAQDRLNSADSALPDLPKALDLVRTAHRYDPLSTDVLMTWASLVDADGNEPRARVLYADATRREPLSPETWYELGAFEYQHRHWLAAYKALDRSWGLDRHGPAGVACDYLDLVRPKVTHYGRKCLGFRRPAR